MTASVTEQQQQEIKLNTRGAPDQEPSMWSVISPVNKQIYGAMALSVLSVLCWFCVIMLCYPLTKELVADNTDQQRVWSLIGGMGLAVVGAFITRTFSFHISHVGSFELEKILRDELSAHMAKVPLGHVLQAGSGSLKKILLDDVRALHVFVADSTPLFAKAFVTPVLGIICLVIVDWRLALAALALFPVGVIGLQLAFKDYATARHEVDSANENISSVIVEYVQGMQVVRTFDDGTASFRRYHNALEQAVESLRVWSGKTMVGAYISRTLFAALPTFLIVLCCGIWLYHKGELGLPELTLALALAPTITESIVPIVWLQQYITNSSAAVKRLNAFRLIEPLKIPVVPKTPQNATIQLDHVTFRYASREDNALEDVSFTANAGSVTALVGPSGSGKSTIAQLVLRFWDVDSGNVTVGGVNVKDMTADALMSHVGFVFQSPFLLHDTIAENIRLGKPEATQAEIEAAAQAAHAHDFILSECPKGYDTIVGERGSALSGGQRQRITIARAILQDSPIIVLDEATAFSDPDNEAKIHAALSRLASGKTLLVVAHRLSTIKDADQIVVLDDGKVAEIGVHDDLAAGDGVYARLWRNFEQAQGWGLSHRNKSASGARTTTMEGQKHA